MGKLFVANLKMLLRNKQALFWSLAFPLIFTVIFGFFFGGGSMSAGTVALVNKSDSELALSMEKALTDQNQAVIVTKQDTVDAARDAIKNGKAAAALIIPEGFGASNPEAAKSVTVLYDPGAVQTKAAVEGIVGGYLTQANYAAAQIQPVFSYTEEKANSSSNFNYFDFVLVGLVGMALMNSAVQGVAIAMSHYRDNKILKRITTTPLPGWSFILAEITSRLLLNVLQVAVILLVGMKFFNAQVSGSMTALIGISLVGAILFQLMGFFIAAISKNTDAAEGMCTAVTTPMMFLSGVFFAIDQLPKWLYGIVQFLPLSPLLKTMRSVALEGGGVFDKPANLGIVGAWIIALLVLTIWKFRLTEE